jgi:hypothetical protein
MLSEDSGPGISLLQLQENRKTWKQFVEGKSEMNPGF